MAAPCFPPSRSDLEHRHRAAAVIDWLVAGLAALAMLASAWRLTANVAASALVGAAVPVAYFFVVVHTGRLAGGFLSHAALVDARTGRPAVWWRSLAHAGLRVAVAVPVVVIVYVMWAAVVINVTHDDQVSGWVLVPGYLAGLVVMGLADGALSSWMRERDRRVDQPSR